MADENGTGLGLVNGDAGGIKTPDEFEALVDAGDKPPRAAVVARARAAGAPALAAVPNATLTPAEAQAEREKIYQQKQVPVPMRPIYNRLPVDEVQFLITHVEVAYRAGLAAGAASVESHVSGMECGHGPVMQMYNEVISKLLEGANLLDGPRPDVAGCLASADDALATLKTWEAEQLQRKQLQEQGQVQSPRFAR
jgi:hypothetical protein